MKQLLACLGAAVIFVFIVDTGKLAFFVGMV